MQIDGSLFIIYYNTPTFFFTVQSTLSGMTIKVSLANLSSNALHQCLKDIKKASLFKNKFKALLVEKGPFLTNEFLTEFTH